LFLAIEVAYSLKKELVLLNNLQEETCKIFQLQEQEQLMVLQSTMPMETETHLVHRILV
jgi:hypothetical protein